jgi:hypothetical protein
MWEDGRLRRRMRREGSLPRRWRARGVWGRIERRRNLGALGETEVDGSKRQRFVVADRHPDRVAIILLGPRCRVQLGLRKSNCKLWVAAETGKGIAKATSRRELRRCLCLRTVSRQDKAHFSVAGISSLHNTRRTARMRRGRCGWHDRDRSLPSNSCRESRRGCCCWCRCAPKQGEGLQKESKAVRSDDARVLPCNGSRNCGPS